MDYIKLSKEISYALRHAPWEYELEMDEEGFVPLNQLLNSLHGYNKKISKDDITYIMATSAKQRFEIVGDKIRAFYGHTIPMHIKKVESEPPAILYHGTAERFLDSIKANGLLPMNRQYVHFSVDMQMAHTVGKRHESSQNPVILSIKAKDAYKAGIKFYIGNDHVWLCDKLPSEFIDWNAPKYLNWDD